MKKTILLLALINSLCLTGNAQNETNMKSPKINFKALKQSHWSEQEQQNVEIIADFVQHLMNDHNFEYITEKFGASKYEQHNKAIPNGVNGLVNFVKNNFAKRFPEYSYDVKWIAADGNMVIFHSHVTMKAKHRGNEKKGLIITDSWRLKDGKIEEHWDAIQGINGFMRFYAWLSGGKVRNRNKQF